MLPIKYEDFETDINHCADCGEKWEWHEGAGEDTTCPELSWAIEEIETLRAKVEELETAIGSRDAAFRELIAAQEDYMAMQRIGRPKESVFNRLDSARRNCPK